MGGLNGRAKRLGQRHGLEEDPQQKARMQDRRAELRAKLDRIIARDGLEPVEDMDPDQQKAIDDFMEAAKGRREQRGA